MKHAVTLGLVVALAACTSPESTRSQGKGPGADRGNRGEVALMHEGAQPFAGTPRRSPAAGAPVETANHAHALSLP